MTGERTTRFRTHSYPTEIVSCSESYPRVLRSLCTYSTRRTREGLLWCAVRCVRLWPGQEFIPRPASGISEYGNKVLLSRPPRRSRPTVSTCALLWSPWRRWLVLTGVDFINGSLHELCTVNCVHNGLPAVWALLLKQLAYTSVSAIISRRCTH